MITLLAVFVGGMMLFGFPKKSFATCGYLVKDDSAVNTDNETYYCEMAISKIRTPVYSSCYDEIVEGGICCDNDLECASHNEDLLDDFVDEQQGRGIEEEVEDNSSNTPATCSTGTGYCTSSFVCQDGFSNIPYSSECDASQKNLCCPTVASDQITTPTVCTKGGTCFDENRAGGYNCDYLERGNDLDYERVKTNQCTSQYACCIERDPKMIYEICNQIPEGVERDDCTTCFNSSGLWTAVGCISTKSTKNIVDKVFGIGLSIAGGVALLMILASAFMFSTSQGEPKRTGEAKEILTSAVIGLLFILFSVTILQFIGVDILHIPGFGE